MKTIAVVAGALAVLCAACGGSSSTPTTPAVTPSTPVTPSPLPSTITVYASNDNLVRWSSSNPADSDTAFPSHEIAVGWNYGNNPTTPPYGWYATGYGSALRFDLQSQIAGRAVGKAILRLYVLGVRDDYSITPQIRVCAFASDWDPNSLGWNAWANLPCQTIGEAQAAAPSSPAAPLDFDITTIVRNWASGSWNNYGLKLMVEQFDPGYTPSFGATWFYTREINRTSNDRPQLIVDFQ